MKKIIMAVLAISCSILSHAQVPEDSVRVADVRISGITCAGDLPIIRKQLVNAEGVDAVAFSPIEKQESVARITYHPALIGEKDLLRLVERAPSCDAPDEFPYRAKPVKKR
jgi:copper chaperone CopZ